MEQLYHLVKLKEHFLHYEKMAIAAGREVSRGQGVGIMRDFFVAESMAEAKRLAGEYVMKSLNWSNWRGPSIYLGPGETLAQDEEAALRKELSYDWVHPRCLLFGTPDYVVDKLEELREALDLELVLVTSDWRGMPHALRMKSLRLFGEKVLPNLKTAPS